MFWFWLICLTLFSSCCRCGFILFVVSYCGSLKEAWRTTGSNGSDNHACLSSKVYGLSWKEMRVDDWGFWVFVSVVSFFLGCCWWGLVWGLLISNFEKFLRVEFL